MASDEGHTEIVGLLLDYGANPDIMNNDAGTASMLAESKGHDNVAILIRNHINLQRALQNLAFMKSVNTRLGDNTPIDDLDYDTFMELSTIHRTYNPSVSSRMRDEERVNPYTEWLQDYGQYGSGKRSRGKRSRGKRSGKRSGKRTKKKRNYRFY